MNAYVEHAKKFMTIFLPYLLSINESPRTISEQVKEFNKRESRDIQFTQGATRRCLIGSDYVIKWDYDLNMVQEFGGCENELDNYNFACMHGFDYLFAAITPIIVEGYKFYVMPKIDKLALDSDYYYPTELLTEEEQEFIYQEMHLDDLHDENWGWLNGEIKIIDYACNGSC